ncbi:MAG TPA: phage tail tape measure protein [Sphingobium sp.]|nr:phage tail tape measure protein [Sphingobium sp.]
MSDKALRLIVSFATNDKLTGPLKNIVGLAQSGRERFAGMKREVRDLERELKGVQREMGTAGADVGQLAAREAELQQQLARANAEMEKQERLLKRLASADQMIARGESLKGAGQHNMMMGAAMAAPLLFAGKAAMDYEKRLALIAQKSDLSATTTEKFGQRILAVASDTAQSSGSLLDAVDFLGGKGVSVANIDAMLPAIGKFATAWDADVVDASKAAYAGFLSLHVPLKETERSLEIMAAAGNAGGFEVKDMAQYFPGLTANMATFGAKGVGAVADLSAALQVLEAKTGDGAEAATNLSNLLTFAKTNRGIQNFKKFGVDISAALKKAEKEGASPIQTLIDLINKATKGDTSKIPQLISDQQAGKGALALIDSAKRYQEIKAEALAAVGLTEKEFNRMSETSAANFQRMQTALQGLTLTAGTHLLPMLTDGVKWITSIVNAVAAWARANPETAKTLLQIVAAFAAFRIGLGALQFVFGSSLVLLGNGFKLVLKHGPALMTVLGGVRTAALFLARGVLQAGAMMLANPVVAAIVAIVAALGVAGYLIWKHWDKIKGIFAAGLAFVRGLPGQFMAAGRAIIDGLLGGLSARWNALKDKISAIGSSVSNWFKDKLGIHSPSRVFMDYGRHIAGGLALGIAQAQAAPAQAAQTMADRVMSAPRLDDAPRSGTGAGRPGAAMSFGPITFNIYAQPGQSAQDIAAEVERILREREGRGSASRRSEFRDDEE